ncbi:hypothetical protein B0H19DRAFT_995362 [Mycena capillaripes]|nr:hypothetical protein B0H19DRAFT_995362 [Mycena capillaripes]
MPEARESEAEYQFLSSSVTALIESDTCLHVERIDIDATDKEASRFKKNHPARDGLPYAIESSSTVKRGTNKAQNHVYPQMWRTTGKKKATSSVQHSVTDLTLKEISYTYRALVLDLGPLFLMIQWLTHTSAQLYPRFVWESTIKLMDKKVRKARVGMALVFADYVLAFLSSDLVFQPTWATSREALPPSPADFHSSDWTFISALAQWIASRADCDRNGLACDVIRSASHVFLGIGVYTVNEIFFLAGLSLLLTEAEVFSNPSRTGRFTVGYSEFLRRSRTGLGDLLRPAMKDGFLAPTIQQRLGYINWLHVYAKDRTRLPARMAILVDDYKKQLRELSLCPTWYRYNMHSLHDIFEPSLVSTALSLPHNLGHLIYGRDMWVALGGCLSDGHDELTSLFREQGLLDAPTFLRPGHYTPLFLETHDVSSLSLPRRHIYTYRWDKQMWSITPFPRNCHGRHEIEDSASPVEIAGEARHQMLFSYIVQNTRNVAIGPLEYCGNAHRVSIGSSTVVVPCYGDPSLSEFYAIRDLKNRALPSALPGARRPQMSASVAKGLEYEVTEYEKGVSRKRARDEEENQPPANGPVKIKKKRLSADQRLALACIN